VGEGGSSHPLLLSLSEEINTSEIILENPLVHFIFWLISFPSREIMRLKVTQMLDTFPSWLNIRLKVTFRQIYLLKTFNLEKAVS